jgi:hypothetical protein
MFPPYITSSGVVYKYNTSTGQYTITTDTPAPVIITSSGSYYMQTSTGELMYLDVPTPPDEPEFPGIIITQDSDSSLFFPKYTISATGVDVDLPVTFSFPGVDLNKIFGFPGTSDVPISMGSGQFDFGLKITFICPGFPVCGAKSACSYSKTTPTWSLNPTEWFSYKIPGIPKIPHLPTVPSFNYSIPPKWMLPKGCANYTRSQQDIMDNA